MTIINGDVVRQRSTVQLVKDLTHQATTLVHQELDLVKVELNENLDLAKAELAEKGKEAGTGVAALTAAGVAGLLALGTLTGFLILALDGVMPNWAAALCVAGLWALVAVPLALYGRNKIQNVGTPVPEKTIESVKEDVAWLKHQTS
jgi:hypothetical protein